MQLAHLQVHSSVIPEYFYDFPEGTERSVKGSIHFRPGTVHLTEDELKHIESDPQFGHLKGKYTVVSRPSDTTPQAEMPQVQATEGSTLTATPDGLESSGKALVEGTTKPSKFRSPA